MSLWKVIFVGSSAHLTKSTPKTLRSAPLLILSTGNISLNCRRNAHRPESTSKTNSLRLCEMCFW